MKRVILLAPALLVAGAAQAEVIDLSGIEVTGDGPVTFSIFQEEFGALAGFNWDINYEAFSPSWGSELGIELTHESGFSYSFGGNAANGGGDQTFGWGNSSGVFNSVGGNDTTGLDETYGAWTITITDSFNDGSVEPDGVILQGFIEIKKVPAPGAFALLGMAGLIGRRRRR